MTLAYFKCRYELHEPTEGTAEETEAGLPATETASGRNHAYPALHKDDDWRFGLPPSHSV